MIWYPGARPLQQLTMQPSMGFGPMQALKEGWLWKQSKRVGVWHRRWYIYKQGILTYVHDPKSFRGECAALNAEVTAVSLEEERMFHATRELFGFWVGDASGSQRLMAAEGEEARSQWLATLLTGQVPLSQRYRIQPHLVLGEGVFAQVVCAQDLATGTPCAIKVLSPSTLASYPDLVEKEVRLWSLVSGHPHVAALREIQSGPAGLVFVSELCGGGQLVEVLADHPTYCEQDAAQLMGQLLGALAHCHAAGVAHLDIKPENVLMKARSLSAPLKLVDFGLSSFFHTPTEPGGTPEFVAPELITRPESIKAAGCGGEVDMWAVGVLLCYLLVGVTPFDDDNVEAILGRVRRGEGCFAHPAWLDISPQAKHLISSLLKVDPAARLTAAAALRHPWVASPGCAPQHPLEAALAAFREEKKLKALERQQQQQQQHHGHWQQQQQQHMPPAQLKASEAALLQSLMATAASSRAVTPAPAPPCPAGPTAAAAAAALGRPDLFTQAPSTTTPPPANSPTQTAAAAGGGGWQHPGHPQLQIASSFNAAAAAAAAAAGSPPPSPSSRTRRMSLSDTRAPKPSNMSSIAEAAAVAAASPQPDTHVSGAVSAWVTAAAAAAHSAADQPHTAAAAGARSSSSGGSPGTTAAPPELPSSSCREVVRVSSRRRTTRDKELLLGTSAFTAAAGAGADPPGGDASGPSRGASSEGGSSSGGGSSKLAGRLLKPLNSLRALGNSLSEVGGQLLEVLGPDQEAAVPNMVTVARQQRAALLRGQVSSKALPGVAEGEPAGAGKGALSERERQARLAQLQMLQQQAAVLLQHMRGPTPAPAPAAGAGAGGGYTAGGQVAPAYTSQGSMMPAPSGYSFQHSTPNYGSLQQPRLFSYGGGSSSSSNQHPGLLMPGDKVGWGQPAAAAMHMAAAELPGAPCVPRAQARRTVGF